MVDSGSCGSTTMLPKESLLGADIMKRAYATAACSLDLNRPMCTTEPSLVARTSKAVTWLGLGVGVESG